MAVMENTLVVVRCTPRVEAGENPTARRPGNSSGDKSHNGDHAGWRGQSANPTTPHTTLTGKEKKENEIIAEERRNGDRWRKSLLVKRALDCTTVLVLEIRVSI